MAQMCAVTSGLNEGDKKTSSNNFPKCAEEHVHNFQGNDFFVRREYQVECQLIFSCSGHFQDDTSQSLLSSGPVFSKFVPKGLKCAMMASL